MSAPNAGLIQNIRRKLAAFFGSVRICNIDVASIEPRAWPRNVPLNPTAFPVRAGNSVTILSGQEIVFGASDVSRIPVLVGADVIADLQSITTRDGLLAKIVGQSEHMALDPVNLPHIHQLETIPRNIAQVREPEHTKIERPMVRLADTNRPRLLTKADRRAIPTALNRGRVGHMPSAITTELAMERRRESMPTRDRTPMGFEREMALLRTASGEPDADIKLVGVYCNVPIGAASRLEFDPATGSLMLNIRDKACETIASAKRQVVTLVLGQIVNTGRMVRAFRPDPIKPPRE